MGKKIKILFLINTFKRGGSTRVFLNQINALSKKNYDVYLGTVVNFNKKDSFLPELNITSNKIKFFKFKSIFDVKSYFELCNFIKNYDVDIIYSTMDVANIISRVVKILKPSTKVVIRESGMADRKTIKSKFIDIILNFFVDMVIAQTNELRKTLFTHQKIYQKKTVVLNNGVQINEWGKILRQKRVLKKRNDGFIILNIGTMRTTDKGQKELLEMFKNLVKKQRSKGVKLILVGDGVLRKEYENFVYQNGLSAKVKFTGKVDYRVIQKYYLMADVYITFSKTEGFSNTLLEAMSYGLPVISTRVSGASEAIQNKKSGFLVDIGQWDEAGRIVKQLINNPNLKSNIGLMAYQRVKEKYSMEKNIDKLIDYIQCLFK